MGKPTGESPRVVLVSHDESWPRANAQRDFVDAISSEFSAPVLSVDTHWSNAFEQAIELHPDVVLVFVRFRQLRAAASLCSRQIEVPVIAIEWDAFMDEWPTASPYANSWVPTYRRLGITGVAVSGVRSVERFRSQGFPTWYLPKGFDSSRFSPDDREEQGEGIVHFGRLYRARRALLGRLRRASAPVEHIEVPYIELGAALGKYAGGIAFMPDWEIPFGKLGRGVERCRPGTLLRVHREIEPMQKFFEIAGSGLAPLNRKTADFSSLGFEDDSSVIHWDSLDDLIDKVRYYAGRPDELVRIGSEAAHVAHERHSWRARASELRPIVQSALSCR